MSINARRLTIAILIFVFAPMHANAQAAATELYRGTHGIWTVLCMQDRVDNHRECGVFAKAAGQNPLTETELMLFLGARDWRNPPSITIKEPVLGVHDLIFKVDNLDPTNITCPDMQNGACTITGDLSNRLIQSWLRTQTVILRLTAYNGTPYDFTYDMREFSPAMTDFLQQLQKFG